MQTLKPKSISLFMERSTPVIRALLSDFTLIEIPCYGRSLSIDVSPFRTTDWTTVRQRLIQVALDLGIVIDPAQALTNADVVRTLARHFDTHTDLELEMLIQRNQFSGTLPVETAIELAWHLNDGHNLCATRTALVLSYDEKRRPARQVPENGFQRMEPPDDTGPVTWALMRVVVTLDCWLVRADVRRRRARALRRAAPVCTTSFPATGTPKRPRWYQRVRAGWQRWFG